MKRIRFLLVLLALCAPLAALAEDVVVLNRPVSVKDHRRSYSEQLLYEVLERTRAQFGPYEVQFGPVHMERDRLLEELQAGKLANLVANAANPEWTKALLAVEIPIDLGLQSWRLAFIDIRRQAQIRATADVRQLRVGGQYNWVSVDVLRRNGFQVVPGNNYEGLFGMLMAGRFDYFPRGVNEIFDEYAAYGAAYPGLVIDDSFVLHDRVPSYFFVSPKAPRLAARLKAGMEAMLKDGSLERFMLTHYRDSLVRAKLCNRKVVELPNPDLPPAIAARAKLWFNPLDPRNGICPAAARN